MAPRPELKRRERRRRESNFRGLSEVLSGAARQEVEKREKRKSWRHTDRIGMLRRKNYVTLVSSLHKLNLHGKTSGRGGTRMF